MNKFFVLIITGLIGMLYLQACTHEKASPSENEVNIEIAKVKQVSLPAEVKATGRLASEKETKLSFKTSGIIRRIYLSEGDYAEAGQILASLNLSEVQAMQKQAQTAYNKALRDFERAENLYRDSVATKEQYQNTESALKAAEAQLEIVNFNLRHSVIKAPGKGKILKQLAESGEMIAAGHPVFLFAGLEDAWIVRAGITGKDRSRINKGDNATVQLTAFPDTSFNARVSEIGAFANPYTGVFETKIQLTDVLPQAASGMTAKLTIVSKEEQKYFSIPIEALLEAQNKTVWVYRYQNGKAVKTTLESAEIRGQSILTKNGLNENDTVIGRGALYIRPESKLIIQN
jgi:RND family efflux transporter MFP subunit